MKISACLVIHNEEKTLDRCLGSIKTIVDEIIVVHDGLCTDNSLSIAKKYGAKIYEQPYIGEAEYHRPFSFQKTSGDWILQIDADEFINESDRNKITSLVENDSMDAYCFRWPYSNNNKYLSRGPFASTYKPCLFRKSKLYMVGISHEYPRTYGIIKKENIHLEHLFGYDKYSQSAFANKWKNWARIQSQQIYNIEQMPIFNIDKNNLPSIYGYYNFIRHYPLLSSLAESIKFITIFLMRGILSAGWLSIVIAWFELRYIWLVRLYLFKRKYE